MSSDAYEGWALIEQMGFRQTIGQIREAEQFGTKMMRIDIPFFDAAGEFAGFVTRFAGGPSLYQITPLDDELALARAKRQADPRPIKPTQYRIAPAEPRGAEDHASDEEEDNHDVDYHPV